MDQNVNVELKKRKEKKRETLNVLYLNKHKKTCWKKLQLSKK